MSDSTYFVECLNDADLKELLQACIQETGQRHKKNHKVEVVE